MLTTDTPQYAAARSRALKLKKPYREKYLEGTLARRESDCPHRALDELGLRCAWLAGFRDR